ncbi:hypothetical protein [Microlunatus parietis]|uniref:Putative lipid-binding transport protein (Tim44 family) n=1 Tax=Microlunatus parietis TaxID=682979 RepID=A0A7Y9I8U9_9ACTN|nr:hypothetical protein [Microlunatus parietis]NYE72220.1 putative lipid-binding transport protein (Tim44 family) [Microlunatus parietis]
MNRARRSSAQPTPAGPRLRRWFGWLLTGLAFGLLIGFAAGLTRPRPAPGFADLGSR